MMVSCGMIAACQCAVNEQMRRTREEQENNERAKKRGTKTRKQ